MAITSPRNVLITGASSGIGAALAVAYAEPGVALALSGRNAARLDQVADRCRARGAAAEIEIIDVAEPDAMADWIRGVDRRFALDLVHANAGVSTKTVGADGEVARDSGTLDADLAVRRIWAVNTGGVVNTVLPAAGLMRQRGRGQIAIMSSLAAYLPLPGTAAYGASKAAVKSYGEALRLELKPQGVGVTVICPGFVRSRMTAGLGVLPFLLDADSAAALIKRRLARNPPIIAFPWPLHLVTWAVGALPAPVRHALLGLGAGRF